MSWHYTVHKGKRYKAKVQLNWFESFGTNEQVAAAFAKVGFEEIIVKGSGQERIAEGTWTGSDQTVPITDPHIVSVEEVKQRAGYSEKIDKPEAAPEPEFEPYYESPEVRYYFDEIYVDDFSEHQNK